MAEREVSYGERAPGKKYVRIAPDSWWWAATDWSQRALKTSAAVTVSSVITFGVSIAEKSEAGIKVGLAAFMIAFPITALLAIKEKIEAEVRRENNITRPNSPQKSL